MVDGVLIIGHCLADFVSMNVNLGKESV